MTDRKLDRATATVHAGTPRPRIAGAVAMPIFQSANYVYGGEECYEDLLYIRLNNTPNHQVLHARLAALEGAEAALVTASGMAAIATTLFSLLSPGDHLLAQDTLYGGTHTFIRDDLARLGIEFDFVAGDSPETWRAKLRPTTRAFYAESLTNPLLDVADLAGIAAFAREHGLVSLIDNTFPSPINFRPLELGFDLALHSCTKYLNGHSDIVAGAVVGSSALVDKVGHSLLHLGGCLDPHAAFLLDRGIKTLAVRMRQHNENGQALAEFLEGHPRVASVRYPGLPSHPAHARASELFDGYSGMLAFEIDGDVEATESFFSALQIPLIAPSLGGVESLVTRPATTSHVGLKPEERAAVGITDRLVRVSTGIEAIADLIADFDQALGS